MADHRGIFVGVGFGYFSFTWYRNPRRRSTVKFWRSHRLRWPYFELTPWELYEDATTNG